LEKLVTKKIDLSGVDQRILFGHSDAFLRLIQEEFDAKIVARFIPYVEEVAISHIARRQKAKKSLMNAKDNNEILNVIKEWEKKN